MKIFQNNAIKKALGVAGATAVAGSLMAAPQAFAYSGQEDPGSGIVWGVGQDGSYNVDVGGAMVQGFCIDPGRAYPNQGGVTRYGPPVDWEAANKMNGTDKMLLATALFIGRAGVDGQVSDQMINDLKGFLNAPINMPVTREQAIDAVRPLGQQAMDGAAATWDNLNGQLNEVRDIQSKVQTVDRNSLIAGASGIVHMLGDKYDPLQGAGSTRWNPDRMNPNTRAVYDLFLKLAPLMAGVDGLTGGIVANELKFQIRHPEGGSQKQRMIVMADIKLPNLPVFPPITPPKIDIPSTTTTTPTGTTSTAVTTRPEGPTGSITPSDTPTRKTESTTPSTTSTTTTNTSTTSTTTSTTTTNTTSSTTSTSEKPEKEIELRTSAGTKAQNIVKKGATITDTVTYQNLEVGKKYTLIGETVNKETGKKTGDKGEVTFEAKTEDGNVDVKIPVSKATASKLVVFETLKDEDGKVVAEHHDIKDRSQTVGQAPLKPEIRTSVDSSTGNAIQSGTVVNDTVRFRNLIPGKKYRLEARLMCKENGQDTGARQTHDFVPESANGETVVQGINVTQPDCLQQVAFEKLSMLDEGDKWIFAASHEDLNDAAQTFGGKHLAKKKKKDAPKPEKKDKPAPEKKAEPNLTPVPMPVPVGAPQPAPMGGGGPAGGSAPRQVIRSVPSGEAATFGNTIFNR